MNDRYVEYCMQFTNDEIEQYFVNYIKKQIAGELKIKWYSSEDLLINPSDDETVEYITFLDHEDVMITFYGHQTSIFFLDEEMMFMDEKAKRYSYTISDTSGNIVYEYELRTLSHEEMLFMFAEIVVIVLNIKEVEVRTDLLPNTEVNNIYYYIPELYRYYITAIGDNVKGQKRVFGNITIVY